MHHLLTRESYVLQVHSERDFVFCLLVVCCCLTKVKYGSLDKTLVNDQTHKVMAVEFYNSKWVGLNFWSVSSINNCVDMEYIGSTNAKLYSTGPMFHPRGPPGPMGMRGPGPRPGELTSPLWFAVEGCSCFLVLCSYDNIVVVVSQLSELPQNCNSGCIRL